MIHALRYTVSVGPRIDRFRAALVIAVAVLEQATGIGLAILLGLFSEAASQRSTTNIAVLTVCVALFIMATQGTFIAGYFTRLRLQEEIQDHVDRQLIDAIGTTPTLDVHEHSSRSDSTAIAQATRGEIGPGFDRLLWLCGSGLALLVSAGLMAAVVPVLALLPFFAIPTVLATGYADKRRGASERRTAPLSRRASHLFGLVTSASTARETRLFSLTEELRGRHVDARDAVDKDAARADAVGRGAVAASWLVFVVAYAVAVILMVRAGLEGTAPFGLVVAAVAVSSQITGQVQTLMSMIYWTMESLRATSAFLRVVDEALEEQAELTPDPSQTAPSTARRAILLEHVSYRYEGRDEPTLWDIDLELPAGKLVALVGENGAGKSTLVNLLTGLYRPSSGRMLVDDCDVSACAPEEWRAKMTVAFQDPAHIEMTLQDAVGLGELAHRGEPERVTAALTEVGGGDLVTSLPDGLETPLGRSSWDGRGLSGGQWQMVSNARAAMRRAPVLRVMDEPSASLDARAEEALFEHYASLSRQEGGVAVLVTHRLTSARAADLIVVLERGRVVETGTHSELVDSNGVYAHLYRLQSRYFVG